MQPSNHQPLGRFLDRLLRRSALSPDEQSVILGLRSRAFKVPSHADVVRPGQLVDHVCLVVDGLVSRFEQMKGGGRQITALSIPGDMCDLHSVVCPVADAGLQALSATTVVYISHDDLRAAVAACPAIALAFWRDTAADASVLAKWLGNMGCKDATAQLAHLLCELGVRMEQAGLGSRTSYRLPATQEQLADVLGLTSVHVNRTLQGLRHNGLLTIRNKTVQIEQWDGLANLAEFDPAYLVPEPVPRVV